MNSRNKTNTGTRGADGENTRHKGESRESQQKGAESVSHKGSGRHRKDESEGASRNTTKKGGNNV